MENILMQTKIKLKEYLSKKIYREELTHWAYMNLMEILKEINIVNFDNMAVYPILSDIAVDENSPEACSDESLKKYIEIIDGKKKTNYMFYLTIPKHKKTSNEENLFKLISNYSITREFKEDELDLLDDLYDFYCESWQNNLIDSIIMTAIELLCCLPSEKSSDSTAIEVNSINLDDDAIKLSNVLGKLDNIINVLSGNKEMLISIQFSGNNYMINMF